MLDFWVFPAFFKKLKKSGVDTESQTEMDFVREKSIIFRETFIFLDLFSVNLEQLD